MTTRPGPRRPGRFVTTLLAVAAATTLIAGCTSGHRVAATTGGTPATSGGAASSDDATPSAVEDSGAAAPGAASGAGTSTGSERPDAGNSAGATGGAAPAGSSTPAQSAAPTGDGQWHPTIRPASDTPTVPTLVAGLLTGLTVTSLTAGSLSAMSNYPYTVTVSGTCTATRKAIAERATAVGMTVLAQGSTSAPSMLGGTLQAQWLDIADGPTDGVDLSLVPGATAKSCAISGVGLTPVALTMTGTISGKVAAFAPVTCAVPFQGALIVGVWAMPLDGTGTSTLSLVATGTGPNGPGKFSAGTSDSSTSSDDDDDGGAIYTSKPLYGYTQMSVLGMAEMEKTGDSDDDSDQDSDEDIESLPPGAHKLTGTVTMSPGMASGSLDLAGGGQHITGTFDCGTPVTH